MMTEQKPDFSNAPFVAELRSVSKQLLPDAAFVSDLEMRLANTVSLPKRPRIHQLLPVAASVAASLILVIALVLTVPSLRVLAQEILDSLFHRTPTDTTALPYIMGGEEVTFNSVEEAEQSLQIDILMPTHLPDDVRLQRVLRPPSSESILQIYEYPAYMHWSLVITQRPDLNDGTESQPVGFSAEIQPVTLHVEGHEIAAEYVEGAWKAAAEIDWEDMQSGETFEMTTEWDAELPTQTLSWQQGGTIYSISTRRDNFVGLELDDLVTIAESMK